MLTLQKPPNNFCSLHRGLLSTTRLVVLNMLARPPMHPRYSALRRKRAICIWLIIYVTISWANAVKITEHNRKIWYLVEFRKVLSQLVTGVCLLSNVETWDLTWSLQWLSLINLPITKPYTNFNGNKNLNVLSSISISDGFSYEAGEAVPHQ